MLRASSITTQRDLTLDAVTKGNQAETTGLEHGELLIAFTEAVVGRDASQSASLRQRILAEMGERQLVDVCGVIGNFHRMTRVADATGIPLDDRTLGISEDLRESLGINAYASAQNTLG